MSGSATVTVASDFNSRPSARGNSDGGGLRIPHQNFNSRPSARGDRRKGYEELFRFISIHAPPRGATRRTHNAGSPRLFQFTPLREGRRNSRKSRLMGRYFNSRPSARGDRCDFSPFELCSISIHAPLRGATGCAQATKDSCFISIHAPPRGATARWGGRRIKREFQFTPLREGRLAQAELSRANQQFQFTPLREGRRC